MRRSNCRGDSSGDPTVLLVVDGVLGNLCSCRYRVESEMKPTLYRVLKYIGTNLLCFAILIGLGVVLRFAGVLIAERMR